MVAGLAFTQVQKLVCIMVLCYDTNIMVQRLLLIIQTSEL